LSVYFCSDYHIDHKNISNFRCKEKGFFRDFKDETEHREWLKEEWNKKITKRDKIFCTGDMAFSQKALDEFKTWTGTKVLIAGNHCIQNVDMRSVIEAYSEVYSFLKYKEFWLSHAPIHPAELRGRKNLHGHVHYYSLDDDRYLNLCVENVGPLISLEDVRKIFEKREKEKGSI
jgi:calcineurin-like phosphoesterase family protein